MNNTSGTFTHPEVWFDVFAEFKRLHEKQPEVEGSIKWALARDLAWTLALSETLLFKQEYRLK